MTTSTAAVILSEKEFIETKKNNSTTVKNDKDKENINNNVTLQDLDECIKTFHNEVELSKHCKMTECQLLCAIPHCTCKNGACNISYRGCSCSYNFNNNIFFISELE